MRGGDGGGLGGSAGEGDPAEDAAPLPWGPTGAWGQTMLSASTLVLSGLGGPLAPLMPRTGALPSELHLLAMGWSLLGTQWPHPGWAVAETPQLVLTLRMLLTPGTAGGSPPPQGARSTGRLLVGRGWRLEHPFPWSSHTVQAEYHGWGERGPLGGGHPGAVVSPQWAPNIPARDIAQWGN